MSAFEKFQNSIGYQFGDRAILIQACTHKSFGHENNLERPYSLRDNERLEFLGDAVLDVIVSDILLETFPEAHEGQLSKMRAALVNEKTLAELARYIGLPEVLRLGKGEMQTGGNQKPSILSGAFEALIGAIYLDGGFAAIYPVVRHLFSPLFTENQSAMFFQDHKTKLQEIVQAQFKQTPVYQVLQSRGPDHAKVFEVEVLLSGARISIAWGSSIKDAEQNAAKTAIHSLSL